MDRRKFTAGSVGLAAAMSVGSRSAAAQVPDGTTPVATPAASDEIGFAFNTGGQSITFFNARTLGVIDTKPLDATVRWLSNEQSFWDGKHIWTYDFPDNTVEALAISPVDASITARHSTGGNGPSHSLMLSSDSQQAWLNIAGDNQITVLSTGTGEIVSQIATGAFPCDIHFTPDGRWGFTPERDQDTVSRIDLASGAIDRTVDFPEGSRPYMLRVTPDGSHVWVQTEGSRANVILDVETMQVVAEDDTGEGPVQSAFGPPGGKWGIVMHYAEDFILIIDRETGMVEKRIDVGGNQGNASFTADGSTALITVTSANAVVALDMDTLEIIGSVPVEAEPMGIVTLPRDATKP